MQNNYINLFFYYFCSAKTKAVHHCAFLCNDTAYENK
jgi:hypothetical protein